MKVTVQHDPPPPPPPRRFLLDCSEDEAQALFALVSGVQEGAVYTSGMYVALREALGMSFSKYKLVSDDRPKLIVRHKP